MRHSDRLDPQLVERWLDENLDVRQRGDEWTCVCPFHQDAGTLRPDLYVNPKKGVYLCMSTACGVRGTIRDLVARVTGVEPDSAAHAMTLSGRRRVEMFRERLAQRKLPDQQEPVISRARLEELRSDRYWVSDRGLLPETTEHFDLGFDDATSRAIIPYRDADGVARYLIQRATGDAPGPRYLYPKGFPLRSALFHLHEVDPREEVIVVEGSVDAMKVWQAGHRNVVALLGSGVFDDQLAALRPLRIVAFVDRDHAGAAALRRLIRYHSRVFRVALYPRGTDAKDPDGLSPEEIRQCIDTAVSSRTWAKRIGL
jgi:DNA primase